MFGGVLYAGILEEIADYKTPSALELIEQREKPPKLDLEKLRRQVLPLPPIKGDLKEALQSFLPANQ